MACTGRYLHGRPAVVPRDGPGTVAGVGPLLREGVGHRHPGIPQLLVGEEEAADGEVTVDGVRGRWGGQAAVQAGGEGSALAAGGVPQR